MTAIYDRDPGDENDYGRHNVTPETGLCVSTWCDDVALPGHEYCLSCLIDVLDIEEYHEVGDTE